MKNKSRAALMSAGIMFALIAANGAQATTYNFIEPTTSTTNGNVNATADITTGLNTLEIVLTNLEVNLKSAGQEISGIIITLGTTPTSVATTPTSTAGSGNLINPDGGVVSPNTIDHWKATLSGANITFTTLTGGQPYDLIIGPGPYTNYNASVPNFDPHIQGEGTFLLSVLGITTSTVVDSVQIQFGTNPDFTSSILIPPGTSLEGTPLPAALPLFATGLGALGLLGWRRKRKAAAFAA